MSEETTNCGYCEKNCQGMSTIHVALFDNDQENRLVGIKSFHVGCFREAVAGDEYIYYDQLNEAEGRIGSNCAVCDKDKSQTGVAIFETNSGGKQMWIQYIHCECFIENAGEDFFD
jgi:hypothetical protein